MHYHSSKEREVGWGGCGAPIPQWQASSYPTIPALPRAGTARGGCPSRPDTRPCATAACLVGRRPRRDCGGFAGVARPSLLAAGRLSGEWTCGDWRMGDAYAARCSPYGVGPYHIGEAAPAQGRGVHRVHGAGHTLVYRGKNVCPLLLFCFTLSDVCDQSMGTPLSRLSAGVYPISIVLSCRPRCLNIESGPRVCGRCQAGYSLPPMRGVPLEARSQFAYGHM